MAAQLDIVKATSNLMIKIILTCLFGEGYLDAKVKQRSDGKEVWMALGETILTQIEKSMSRQFQAHLVLFHELLPYYISA